MNDQTSSNAQSSRSFGATMLKFAVVVGISAMVAGIIVIYRKSGIPSAGEAAMARADLRVYELSLRAYRETSGTYPSTAQGLLALSTRPTGEPKPVMWRKVFDGEIKTDPWGHEYLYRSPGDKNPDGFDLYSVGRDGKANSEDDIWPE
jgi:general secretion pathway protein G